MWKKSLLVPILLLALLLLALATLRPQPPADAVVAAGAAGDGETTGATLDFTARTDSGDSVKLSDYEGEVVLVFAWAHWCPACKATLPIVNRMFGDLQCPNAKMLSVSVDDNRRATEGFLSRLQPRNFQLLYDSEHSAARALRAEGIPTIAVVDQKGHKRGQWVGYQTGDEQEIKRLIEALCAT